MVMATRVQQILVGVACGGTLAIMAMSIAPVADAQTCAPGFVVNQYNGQCLAPVVTPVINGIPCIASNIGICSSFLQNQQPPRRPQSSVG
jgi:hypothetical protein